MEVLGSTRRNRQGERIARWIFEEARKYGDFDIELIDLREWPLPFFDEVASPARIGGDYTSEVARRWSEKIRGADGFIFVTPEYNHGYPAVLKNALDYLFYEWAYKPAAFVSYSWGESGGMRAVEQLRQVAIELNMVPVREAVHIARLTNAFDEKGNPTDKSIATSTHRMLERLQWWTRVMKKARVERSEEVKVS